MSVAKQLSQTPCWTSWSIAKQLDVAGPPGPPPSFVSAVNRPEKENALTLPARWPSERIENPTGETTMTNPNYTVLPNSPLNRIKCWFSNMLAARQTLRDLAAAGNAETARMAGDFNLSGGELRALAAKGPDAANLLNARLAQLGVDRIEEALDPAVARDLQRICSLCDEQRVCSRDLTARKDDDAWKEYCPNVSTLEALLTTPPAQK